MINDKLVDESTQDERTLLGSVSQNLFARNQFLAYGEASTEEQSTKRHHFTSDVKTYKRSQKPRRIAAEDSVWDLDTIPSLALMALKTIAENFSEMPVELERLGTMDKQILMNFMNLTLDLNVAVPYIDDQYYWMKRTIVEHCDEIIHGRGDDWRKTYFEKLLEKCIRFHVPKLSDITIIETIAKLGSTWISELNLNQLLPSTDNFDHIDIALLAEKFLPKLKKLVLSFRVMDAGLNNSSQLTGLNKNDVKNLVDHLPKTKVRSFGLVSSGVNDEILDMLISTKIFEKIKILNLECNMIEGKTRALFNLLSNYPSLKVILLRCNQISDLAVRPVALALAHNHNVKLLDLSYNPLGDEGLKTLSKALLQNDCLQILSVKFTRLTNASGQFIKRIIKFSRSIKCLNIAFNKFTKETYESILQEVTVEPGSSMVVEVGDTDVANFNVVSQIQALMKERAVKIRPRLLKDFNAEILTKTFNIFIA